MEINAKIKLKFTRERHQISLVYDTYEPVSFDKYIIAALIKNTTSKIEAMRYINDISGDGSLNTHFKKLYDEETTFSSNQITRILKNSMYPITVIDEKHYFDYLPSLDISVFEDKMYKGHLANDLEIIKKILMPTGEVTFKSINLKDAQILQKEDFYRMKFSEKKMEVNFSNAFVKISKREFFNCYTKEEIDASGFEIGKTITEGNWNAATSSLIKTLKNERFTYFKNGKLISILDDCIKETGVINVFDMLFYKTSRFDFDRIDSNLCDDILNEILNNNWMNEYKTKNLISILKNASDTKKQEIINYVLERKESKEISTIGISMIKKGLVKGWNTKSTQLFKKFASPNEIQYVYMVNNKLNYTIEELLSVDNMMLAKHDKERIDKYFEDIKTLKEDIYRMLGEMGSIRERMKKLKDKNQIYVAFNKFLNENVGHNKTKYEDMNLEQITKKHQEVKNYYANHYQKIKASVEKLEQ